MTIFMQIDAPTSAALADVAGPELGVADSLATLEALVASGKHDLVVVGADADPVLAFQIAYEQMAQRSNVGVVLVSRRITSALLREALVAGVRDVVAFNDMDAIVEACSRSRALSKEMLGQRPADEGARSGRLVTVFAAKGGCGKTTVATNLATAIARTGRKTCLLDLDLAFGDVAIALQLEPMRTIADALTLSGLDESAVQSLVTAHPSGLHTILAPVSPGTAESIPVQLVAELLDLLKLLYEVVVVDSPPAFTDHVLSAFDRTDDFLLLTTLDVAALKNLKLTLETIALLGYPNERRKIVLNRSDAKVGLSLHDVERTLGAPVALQIPSSRAVPASINRGVPIVMDQPGHPISSGIRRFAEELVAEPTPRRSNKRGFVLRRKTASRT